LAQVVDAHIHFWDPSARHHDWLVGVPELQRRFVPSDLDVGCHDLTGAIFVQADCREVEALGEVRWVAGLAAANPVIRGIVAYAPLHRGRAAEADLRVFADEPLVVGVRRLLQGCPVEEITDAGLIAGIRMLSEFDLAFDLCATHDQLTAVAALVGSCPDTRFVLDHVGKPPVASRELDPWRADLALIGSLPNVTCKLSGLTTEAGAGWTPAALMPYLEHALEVFGPGRCMFASDWPVASLQTTHEAWLNVVLELISPLSPPERVSVLGGTAITTYQLAGF
jgi:L-fuconolactonase